jgi:biotin synthase
VKARPPVGRGVHDWDPLARRVLDGHRTTRDEALAILRAPDAETLPLLAAAYRIRRHHWGDKVHLHLLMNAQSGLCQEDCGYCSQSKVSGADIPTYPMRSADLIVEGARRAAEMGCATYCIVMSGRAPSDRAVDQVAEAVRAIKAEHDLKVCACLGFLDADKARRLREAGVDTYNHNLNTSARHTPAIVSTHGYDDRVATVETAKAAGLHACSGAIFGMGESDEDAVDVALALRELDVTSIPVNFLHPIAGTPLGDRPRTSPQRALKVLAMMRFVNPAKEIRIAGGREVNLRSLQPLALYAANSLFVQGYLTTPGQGFESDLRMIEDLGFTVERRQEPGAWNLEPAMPAR